MKTQSFKAALQNTDWPPVNVLNNVDMSFDRFWDIIKPIYDEQFPAILAEFNKNDHKINGFKTQELLDMRGIKLDLQTIMTIMTIIVYFVSPF